MSRRHRPVALLVAVILSACRREAPPSTAARPFGRNNVVLISVDTLRADRLNSYGYAARKVSRHIDALARDGVLFENHISAAPWTTPAHLSLLTSLSPSAHGVTRSAEELREQLERDRFVDALREERTTMAELLSAQGYRTAAFTGGLTLDPRFGFGQGFGQYDTSMFKLHRVNMERLFAWVHAQRDAPFFLFWHTFEVHAPYVHARFVGDVVPAALAEEVRRSTDRAARGDFTRHGTIGQLSADLARLGVLNREVCDALYAGGIHAMDEWIGEFVRLLRELGLYDRTLIVLTSDHGEEFGDHSADQIYNKHGRTLYEEMVRVPLILKLPGQRHPRTRVKQVSRAIDVLPTVLDALGLEGTRDMEGTALQPLWERPQTTRQGVAFIESIALRSEEKKAVRTDRYKYIMSIDGKTVERHGRVHLPETPARRELYDLWADPGEHHDLMAAEPGRAARLQPDLEALLRRLVAAGGAGPGKARLDAHVLERLHALGYVN